MLVVVVVVVVGIGVVVVVVVGTGVVVVVVVVVVGIRVVVVVVVVLVVVVVEVTPSLPTNCSNSCSLPLKISPLCTFFALAGAAACAGISVVVTRSSADASEHKTLRTFGQATLSPV